MSSLSVQAQFANGALLNAGKLDEVVATAIGWVRANPADADARIGLFQLFCASGDWERAGQQLRVAGRLDAGWQPLVEAYGHVIEAEQEREQVFNGSVTPLMLGPVANWQNDLLQALQHDQRSEHEQSTLRRQMALGSAQAVAGTIDGDRFEWLCDADARFGPSLEVVLEQGYAWIAFEHLRSLTFHAPENLRDLLWRHVDIVWRDGTAMQGLVPCRYPGSERASDSALQLGRRTDWTDAEASIRGLGQRMMASEKQDYPLLELKLIEFDSQPAEQSQWPS